MKKRMVAHNTFEMKVSRNEGLTIYFEVVVHSVDSKDPQDEDDEIRIISAELFFAVESLPVDDVKLTSEKLDVAVEFKDEIEAFVIKNWWKLDFKEIEKDEDYSDLRTLAENNRQLRSEKIETLTSNAMWRLK